MAQWHQQVLAVTADEGAGPNVTQPGRLWEQLAAGIFLENMQVPLWGWADARSVWLLDFWREFTPNLRFLLIYTSPQRLLAHALAQGADEERIAAELQQWQLHQQEILRFHNRHPEHSVLLDAAHCEQHPAALVEACNARWHAKLDPAATQAVSPIDGLAMPLALYLAEHLKQVQTPLHDLQHELEATLHRLPGVASPPAPALAHAVQGWRSLLGQAREFQRQQEELAALRSHDKKLQETLQQQALQQLQAGQQMDEQRQQLQLQQQALRDAESQLARQSTDIAALDGSVRQQQDLLQNNVVALAEARHAHDGDLLRLRQAQQELERLTSLLAESRKTDAAARARDEAQAQALLELRQQCEHQRDHVASLQAELAQNRSKNEVLRKDLSAKQQSVAELTQHLDTQQQSLTSESAQLEAAQQQLSQARADAGTAQHENKLLLLQLHQVQEELERHFLAGQQVHADNAHWRQRWERMLARVPDYCDYAAMAIHAVRCDEPGKLELVWRILDLSAAGRVVARMELSSIFCDGRASLRFGKPDNADDASLAYWPPESDGAVLIGESGGDAAGGAHLSSSDWNLQPVLCRLLLAHLEAPVLPVAPGVSLPAGLNVPPLADAVRRLLAHLRGSVPVLRFDRISLKREQVNPDYEHLWFQLQNVGFGPQHYEQLEFRLSCGNVRPTHFGSHPKLEFPAGAGQVPFESWFEESADDFGPKLELRFALPDGMDLHVWNAVSGADRCFIAALLAALPNMLRRLAREGTYIARKWEDWEMLAINMQGILRQRGQPAVPDAGTGQAGDTAGEPALVAAPHDAAGMPVSKETAGRKRRPAK